MPLDRAEFTHLKMIHAQLGFPQERPVSATPLVEGQPSETQAVAHSPMVLLQGHLPLRAVDDILANAGLPTPLPILMPRFFRQIQFSVHQGVEVRRGVTEVNADDAVFEFTHGPAVLTLDTGGLVAFLGEAGLVDDAHTVPVRMTPGHVLLETIAQGALIPAKQAEELLEIPWRRILWVGHQHYMFRKYNFR